MRRLLSAVGKKMVVVLILLAVVLAIAWWQRTPLLSWYYLRGLAQADEKERAVWVERVCSLGAEAVPGLVGHLKRDDVRVCANAEAALSALAQRWGPYDQRTATLAEDVTGAFSALSTPGREAALEWYLALLEQVDPANKASHSVTETARKLLVLASRVPEKGVHLRTLALAEVMLSRLHPEKTDLYREMALEGIANKDNAVRMRGVRLAMHAPLHADVELLDKIVPLLKDAAPEVRRAALLAVGLSEKHLTVDDLLPLLHDADTEVRRLCEGALRGRGLQDNHIKMAQQISDPRPGERLQVVHYLHEVDDLDPGVWLQRLSQDAAPAVRAAAIRFAAEEPGAVDFRERIQQMAHDDPSPTVQQLARYYLKMLPARD
jgi:hypothetical protein